MTKTDIDILDDLYTLVKGSSLESAVTGRVIRDGKRDANSAKEDIVLSVLTNNASQMQTAVVYVKVFVQSKSKKVTDSSVGSQYVQNVSRLRTLATLSYNFLDTAKGNGYRLELLEQRVYDNSDNEQVIVNKLYYHFNRE